MANPDGPENPDPSGAPPERQSLDALFRRVQELEDLVEELIEIALVNRAGLIAAIGKGLMTRDDLRKVYERIELAHGEARERGLDYRILPGAAAYFLEAE